MQFYKLHFLFRALYNFEINLNLVKFIGFKIGHSLSFYLN